MSLKIDWHKPTAQIAKDALGGERSALFAASEARRLMNQYVPMDTGSLADNVSVYTENGGGIVHYLSPYAQRVYNGDTMHFSREKHPHATARWDAAMQTAHGAELVRAVQAYVKRGV